LKTKIAREQVTMASTVISRIVQIGFQRPLVSASIGDCVIGASVILPIMLTVVADDDKRISRAGARQVL